ncbi:MAG: exo-alpha-sialidase [Pirellulales bacterium]|nr:exo-alpha-sialidase [Pirellulales bacterium]
MTHRILLFCAVLLATGIGPVDPTRYAAGQAPGGKPAAEDFTRLGTFQVPHPPAGKQMLMDFPSLTKLRGGQWLTIFIEEPQHGTPPWAAMPASGRLWTSRTADEGRAWTDPAIWLDTPLDDRHAYTLQLKNGDLVAFWWVQTVAFGINGIFNYTARSHDGGRTWEDPRRIRTEKPVWPEPPNPGIQGGFSLTNPPIELPDGTLAMAMDALSKPPSEAGILRSRDDGRTWGDYSPIAVDPEGGTCFNEPCVVRLASGKWITVMRTTVPLTRGTTHPYTNGPTMVCTSTDEGRTWSKPDRLPLEFTWTGSTAPFILQTKSGVVVFAVNTGMAFSFDDGRTWVPQGLVPGYYPNLLEVSPGTVATIACELGGHVIRPSGPQPPAAPETDPGPPSLEPKPIAAIPEPQGQLDLGEIRGMPRAIRVRGTRDWMSSPLVGTPDYPLAAAARGVSNGEEVVAVLLSRPDQKKAWPLLVAKAAGVIGEPLLAEAHGGELLCAIGMKTGDRPTTMLARSRDGGLTWTPPAALDVEGTSEPVMLTSPPVETVDGVWLAAAAVGSQPETSAWAILRSSDAAKTWRPIAHGPEGTTLAEPSLALARDGRWVVAGRQLQSSAIVALFSKDQGTSWSPPKPMNLTGARPEIVELFEDLFLVTAEGPGGDLLAAYTWDDLEFSIPRPLACAHCFRVGPRKVLARGSGVDMAGRFSNLAQVPLEPDEIEAVGKTLTARLPLKPAESVLKGEWKTLPGEAGTASLESEGSRASIEISFEGRAVGLVHDVMPGGRLVGIQIDGREYPPVDMSGPARSEVLSPLAAGLSPGRHKLVLWPLLPWRAGTMRLWRLQAAP